MSQTIAGEPEFLVLRPAFTRRALYVFGAMALACAALSAGGRWVGHTIAMAGNTEDRTLHAVAIGDDVVTAPANMIRNARARRDDLASRLDLYLRWPDMEGYTAEARNDFNHAGGQRNIVFLSFEPRMMSRDMSGRLDLVYRRLIEPKGQLGPAGISLHAFKAQSGYSDEVLAVAENGGELFVARCLTGANAEESLAPCERDISIGKGLSLTYRFPRELLGDWSRLDGAISAQAAAMVRTKVGG